MHQSPQGGRGESEDMHQSLGERVIVGAGGQAAGGFSGVAASWARRVCLFATSWRACWRSGCSGLCEGKSLSQSRSLRTDSSCRSMSSMACWTDGGGEFWSVAAEEPSWVGIGADSCSVLFDFVRDGPAALVLWGDTSGKVGKRTSVLWEAEAAVRNAPTGSGRGSGPGSGRDADMDSIVDSGMDSAVDSNVESGVDSGRGGQ